MTKDRRLKQTIKTKKIMTKERRLNEDEILEYIKNGESFENFNNRSIEHIIETIVYNFGCESEIAFNVAKKIKK